MRELKAAIGSGGGRTTDRDRCDQYNADEFSIPAPSEDGWLVRSFGRSFACSLTPSPFLCPATDDVIPFSVVPSFRARSHRIRTSREGTVSVRVSQFDMAFHITKWHCT